MNIALLDDDPRENENLYSLINAYAILRKYDISCEKFTSGKIGRAHV